jgi:galactose mutarotase-like enzyme
MRATLSASIFVERVVSLESNPMRVKLTTSLQNLSDESTSFIWGEHPAFIAQPGDRIDLPVASVMDTEGISLGTWPVSSRKHPLDVVGSESPTESVHFVTNLSNGWAALRRSDIGVALAWDVRDFPHVWLWRENGTKGFPFFGRASLIAIEPASSWPGTGLGEACKRGQALSLSSHESRSTVVALVPFTTTTFPVCNVSVSGQIDFES